MPNRTRRQRKLDRSRITHARPIRRRPQQSRRELDRPGRSPESPSHLATAESAPDPVQSNSLTGHEKEPLQVLLFLIAVSVTALALSLRLVASLAGPDQSGGGVLVGIALLLFLGVRLSGHLRNPLISRLEMVAGARCMKMSALLQVVAIAVLASCWVIHTVYALRDWLLARFLWLPTLEWGIGVTAFTTALLIPTVTVGVVVVLRHWLTSGQKHAESDSRIVLTIIIGALAGLLLPYAESILPFGFLAVVLFLVSARRVLRPANRVEP